MSNPSTPSPVAKLVREPLFHFLAAAGLIFWINANYSGDDRELITIEQATIDFLVKQEQDLRLSDLDSDERQALVEQFIDDEILVREARKRGFDDSSRIRILLIQNMRFFVKQDLPAPSEADLQAYLAVNLERFTTPPTVDMEQLFFENPEQVPVDMLATLNKGADYREYGDNSFNFGKLIRKVRPRNVADTFARGDAESIVAIADNQWHGPFSSDYGVHFLRVASRYPASPPKYEPGLKWLELQWFSDQQRATMDEALREMRKDYRIELKPAVNTKP